MTITKVRRISGDVYKTAIRLRGIKPVSKTSPLKKLARARADRMERDINASRAYGNKSTRQLTLGGYREFTSPLTYTL